jgi:hypothetical protein
MTDTSPCTIKKHLLYVCGFTRKDDVAIWMKKYRKFCLTFNKAAPAKDNLCQLEKQRFLTGSVLGVKQSRRPLKYTDVMLIWRSQLFTLKKVHKKSPAWFQISRTTNFFKGM